MPKGRSGPRSTDAPRRHDPRASATRRYVQSSPSFAKMIPRSAPDDAGVNAVGGTIAKPPASVVNVSGCAVSGRAMVTLAPATGAAFESRVTHTMDPYGETLALIARSVTCATTPLVARRASRVPGRSV